MEVTVKYEVGQFYKVRISNGMTEQKISMLCVKRGKRTVRFQYLMRHIGGFRTKHEERRWLGSWNSVETCHVPDVWYPRTSYASDKADKPKDWDKIEVTK